jgi:hypothetical protein
VLHAAEPYQLRVCHIVARFVASIIHLQKYELIPKPPTFPQKNCHNCHSSAILPLSKKELPSNPCTIQNYCLSLQQQSSYKYAKTAS